MFKRYEPKNIIFLNHLVICVFKTNKSFDTQNTMYVQLVVHVLFKNPDTIRLLEKVWMNRLRKMNKKKPKNIEKSKRI